MRACKDLFLEIRRAWSDVPFEVVNDGEVTALAGSMSLGVNAILGIALGTSTAAGYVTRDGNITSWLDELAFVPIDYNPAAPVDEWSGDYGVGSQYFSQQCVGPPDARRRASRRPQTWALPEKLKLVQELMAAGDYRAPADLRDDRHVPRLRRRALRRLLRPRGTCSCWAASPPAPAATTSSTARARCSTVEFPELAARIAFHVPDERTSATARPSPPPACRRSARRVGRSSP